MGIRISPAAARVNANMTQKEWARELGVSANSVNMWENGKGEPNISIVRRMSELSGIPIDWIYFTQQSKYIGKEEICQG